MYGCYQTVAVMRLKFYNFLSSFLISHSSSLIPYSFLYYRLPTTYSLPLTSYSSYSSFLISHLSFLSLLPTTNYLPLTSYLLLLFYPLPLISFKHFAHVKVIRFSVTVLCFHIHLVEFTILYYQALFQDFYS